MDMLIRLWNKIFMVLIILHARKEAAVQAAIQQIIDDYDDNIPCYIDGSQYKYGERIPRDHPCHLCLCLRGQIECAWQDCPLTPEGCTELTIPNICNPSLYLCSIPETVGIPKAVTRSSRKGVHVKPGDSKQQTVDCNIMGVPYRTGDVVGVASHNCLECRCGKQDLYCSPRCCFRPATFWDSPGAIMKHLQIGPKLPALNPLSSLVSEATAS